MTARIPLVMLMLLLAPATLPAQDKPEEKTEERPTGLPSPIAWTFNLDAGWGTFGFAQLALLLTRGQPFAGDHRAYISGDGMLRSIRTHDRSGPAQAFGRARRFQRGGSARRADGRRRHQPHDPHRSLHLRPRSNDARRRAETKGIRGLPARPPSGAGRRLYPDQGAEVGRALGPPADRRRAADGHRGHRSADLLRRRRPSGCQAARRL